MGGIADAFGGHVVEGGDVEDVGGFFELAFHAVACCRDHWRLEVVLGGVDAVEEDVVVFAGESAGGGAAEAVGPDEVVDEMVFAEELVEKQADMMGCSPVGVDEDVGGGFEFGKGGLEAITEPCEPRGGRWPRVGVGVCFGGLGFASVEGGIDIEEVDGVVGEGGHEVEPVGMGDVLGRRGHGESISGFFGCSDVVLVPGGVAFGAEDAIVGFGGEAGEFVAAGGAMGLGEVDLGDAGEVSLADWIDQEIQGEERDDERKGGVDGDIENHAEVGSGVGGDDELPEEKKGGEGDEDDHKLFPNRDHLLFAKDFVGDTTGMAAGSHGDLLEREPCDGARNAAIVGGFGHG